MSLIESSAFPTIVKTARQVGGMTVRGSSTPNSWPQFPLFVETGAFPFETKTEVIATSYQNSLFSGVTAHATKNHQITRFGLNLA